MQELQNSGRYELLHGFGESGKGDGTYIDKESTSALPVIYGRTDCTSAAMVYNLTT